VIPIRDDNPVQHFPIVTVAIIALNVLAFLLWQPTFDSETDQQTFFFCHAEIPWEVTHQTSLGEGGPEARKEIAEQFQEGEGQAAQDQRFLEQHCGNKSWWESIFVAMFLHGSWLHIGGFTFGARLALLFFPKERFGALPPPRRPDVPSGWGLGRRRPPPFGDQYGGGWPG